ncbi:MAG: cryptochrome/photolyase family protein [Bacteroidota bacterium]
MSISFFWFRRDLRLDDNAGLFHALKSGLPVQPIFIFDTDILEKLEDRDDRRVTFLHRHLHQLDSELQKLGSTLMVFHGRPLDVWKKIMKEHKVTCVHTNHDYEPYAIKRDQEIEALLGSKGIPFKTYKDQVIFEKSEVVKDDGSPYTVYTPYMRKWRARLQASDMSSFDCKKHRTAFHKTEPFTIPSLTKLGFKEADLDEPSTRVADKLIKEYGDTRDFPGIAGTTRLGVHLRFGTISVRQLANRTFGLSEKYFNELIWREFYQMILWHFPHVTQRSFKPQYDVLPWRNDEKEFERWCKGETGYPIVDAGMRELAETGYMHNRVRMITAQFLTKFLLVDWRWGEHWFARKLLDFDLASNNGGWQWSAGTGVDAAPYFRIFNMDEQTKKFDKDFTYIKKWVPEFQELDYPRPMVDYKFARQRCLDFYKKALGS